MIDTHKNIDPPKEKISDFCQRWKVTELDLFGSVLRDDFRSDSDVDVLVTFATESKWGLFDLVHMRDELQAILGRKVDLVERRAIEESDNPFRRKHVLDHLEPIYVA
jgi:hypothetical protein